VRRCGRPLLRAYVRYRATGMKAWSPCERVRPKSSCTCATF